MPDLMVANDDSWFWALIPGVFDTVAAPGYAAYIDIDRNLNDNPIPKSCGNKENGRSDEHKSRKQVTDNVIGIYPSVDGIEKFLVHLGATRVVDRAPAAQYRFQRPSHAQPTFIPRVKSKITPNNQKCMPN